LTRHAAGRHGTSSDAARRSRRRCRSSVWCQTCLVFLDSRFEKEEVALFDPSEVVPVAGDRYFSKASFNTAGLDSGQAYQEPQDFGPAGACARPKPFQPAEPGAYCDTRPAAVAATPDATPSRVRLPSRFT
jgi:hypothetical protein